MPQLHCLDRRPTHNKICARSQTLFLPVSLKNDTQSAQTEQRTSVHMLTQKHSLCIVTISLLTLSDFPVVCRSQPASAIRNFAFKCPVSSSVTPHAYLTTPNLNNLEPERERLATKSSRRFNCLARG
ncbi:hypothetical protein P3T22_006018 [Paraburkholderia sp. GAS348]